MSRNRPRPRDNGFGNNEELELWTKICQDIRKSKEKFDQQSSLSVQIKALIDKITNDGNKATLAEHDQLDSWLRQSQKLSEDERSIMQDEPCDVIKNLELLTALRKASEAEAPPNRSASFNKSRKKRNEVDGSVTDSPSGSGADKSARSKGTAPRSSSVSSSAPQPRDGGRQENIMVKIEESPSEGTKGTIAERSGILQVGSEVVFKHNKNKQGVEGEGIQCIIKAITGEGQKKRYEVQDPEPNENGEHGSVYKTTAVSLIPIPKLVGNLTAYTAGKQVLARYPDTTTFYRAEVMGSRKDVYRLKFEGEEDDKEMEVDRRFVLDIPGK